MSTGPISLDVIESEERQALRATVSELGRKFGPEYMREKIASGEGPTELWKAAGDLGLVGVNIAEEYGGGGAGMYELGIVGEELAAAGSSLLMLRLLAWTRTPLVPSTARSCSSSTVRAPA